VGWRRERRERRLASPTGTGRGTTQTFQTVGLIPAISYWIFSRGSYEGSFRGELEKFARIAERGARFLPDWGRVRRRTETSSARLEPALGRFGGVEHPPYLELERPSRRQALVPDQ
jgi:hypothetical protein